MKVSYQILIFCLSFFWWVSPSAFAQTGAKVACPCETCGPCAPTNPCPYGLSLSGSTAYGPVPSDGAGNGVAYPNSAASGIVDVYTPVTLTVNGYNVGLCVWTIYTSTGSGPSSYTSSSSGNQLYITPQQPASMYAPNGTLNGDQSYSIFCSVSNNGCNQSTSMEYTLYSRPATGSSPGPGPTPDPTPVPGLQATQAQVETYPSPADQHIIVSATRLVGTEAFIYDSHGILQKRVAITGSTEVPTQNLKSGIYYLRVKSTNGNSIQKRIIISH